MRDAQREYVLALEAIAYDDAATAGERLRALELLEKTRQQMPDGVAVFDLSGLSGEALDVELAGFLQPGAVYEAPAAMLPIETPDDDIAASVIERIAGEEETTTFRKATAALARLLDGRTKVPEEQAQPRRARGARVVPMPRREDRPMTEQERVREELRLRRQNAEAVLARERRDALPPAIRNQVPEGLDPRVLGQAWPSGRP